MDIDDYEWLADLEGERRERREEPVGITYHAKRNETAKAVLFEIKPGFNGSTQWVPKSLLQSDGVDLAGERRFYVPRWWAEENDLL